MASPWKHPKTGMYWFRRRVPDALRPLVGKTIVQRSLETKDPAEAKRLFLPIALAVDREWARLLAEGPRKPETLKRLDPKQIQGLAGEFYRWFVSQHDGNPGRADGWRDQITQDLRWLKPSGRRPGNGASLYMPQVQRFLEERGILVSDVDLWDVATAAAFAGTEAKERLVRMAGKDYSDDPAEARYPKWNEVAPTLKIKSQMLTLEDDYEEYAKTKSPGTRKKYRSCLNDLVRFIGTKDLNTVTPELVQAWVEDLASRMIGEGNDAKRKIGDKDIAHGYLAATRSFFGWAVKKRKAKSNPAADIDFEIAKKPRTRKPYFSDEERDLILSEALRAPSGRESLEFAAAKRWVPWICAYTGARVNEITQLRGMDVVKRNFEGEAVWTINITPDAGPVKTGEAREVPLHSHLVEQGFPEFVASRGKGPLFYDPGRRRGGSDENPLMRKVGDKLAAWVRKIGVPKGVAPNHGWRHRFNAVGRRVRMVPEIRDGINGHKPRTEGEEYGGYIEWDMMWPEIKLIPRINVAAAVGPLPHTAARAKATQDRAATRRRAKARAKVVEAAQ